MPARAESIQGQSQQTELDQRVPVQTVELERVNGQRQQEVAQRQVLELNHPAAEEGVKREADAGDRPWQYLCPCCSWHCLWQSPRTSAGNQSSVLPDVGIWPPK